MVREKHKQNHYSFEGEKQMKTTLKTTIATGALALSAFAAPVGLQFDFGTGSVYTGTDAPAQAAGALTATDSTWNGYSNFNDGTDGQAVGFYADGTAASGITIDFGDSWPNVATTNDVSWSDYPSGNGAAEDDTSIYDTAFTADWVYTGTRTVSGTKYNRMVGIRVKGLEAGSYDIYTVAHEPTQLNRSIDVYTGVNISSSAGLTPLDLGRASGIDTWTEGNNYVLSTVTLTGTDDWLTVMAIGDSTGHVSLNGLQIVENTSAVPEPSAMLLGILASGFVLLRRRR